MTIIIITKTRLLTFMLDFSGMSADLLREGTIVHSKLQQEVHSYRHGIYVEGNFRSVHDTPEFLVCCINEAFLRVTFSWTH